MSTEELKVVIEQDAVLCQVVLPLYTRIGSEAGSPQEHSLE